MAAMWLSSIVFPQPMIWNHNHKDSYHTFNFNKISMCMTYTLNQSFPEQELIMKEMEALGSTTETNVYIKYS